MMLKIKVTLIFFISVFLLSGCVQNEVPFLITPARLPSSTAIDTFTPTVTQTPTLTLTPSITPTSTMTVAPTATPNPLASCINKNPDIEIWSEDKTEANDEGYIGAWRTEMDGMTFEAFACPDSKLIAIFYNQDFGETITINQGTTNNMEYSWSVSVDVNSEMSTGVVLADYELSLAHWANGRTKTVPFKDGFQINVWKCDTESCKLNSWADWYVDQENKMIILKGNIPEINADSKVVFSRFHFSLDNKLSYKTDWVINSLP